MRDHVRILGVLYIAWGVMGMMAALICLAVFAGIIGLVGAFGSHDADVDVALPLVALFGIGLFLFLALLSLPNLIAGIGLLRFRRWARVLTIVLSALNFMGFPLGTLIGGYGLWVTLSARSDPLFAEDSR